MKKNVLTKLKKIFSFSVITALSFIFVNNLASHFYVYAGNSIKDQVDEIWKNINDQESEHVLSYLKRYYTGYTSEDGGIAEIVKYNWDNQKIYLVNGLVKTIDIVSLSNLNRKGDLQLEKSVDVSTMIEGFTFGDITSVDINHERKIIAVAVQEEDYTGAGAVILLDYDGNYITHYFVGVQPDMVTFTPNGNAILTADEGEPRLGYGKNNIDPKGSVTIIDLSNGLFNANVNIVYFEAFDTKRDQLIDNKVILKKNTPPSVDLEPEYISVTSDSRFAYVTLQEANAIATLDINKGVFTKVQGLGFKNHNLAGNELDLFRDSILALKNEDVYSVYMPDGIALYEIEGKTYLITANEGDSREWGDYSNVSSVTINGNKFDALNVSEHDGLEPDKIYVFGARSFSIWDADNMKLVYDSGSQFEKISSLKYPSYFNVSNDNLTMDHRSSKKGPEPEDVKVAYIDGKYYAAIGLERIGGVMLYDVTDPSKPKYIDYMNSRQFDNEISGDVAPEGLTFVEADKSPTGYPLLIAAHEVSGTVAIYQMNAADVIPVIDESNVPYHLFIDRWLDYLFVKIFSLQFEK